MLNQQQIFQIMCPRSLSAIRVLFGLLVLSLCISRVAAENLKTSDLVDYNVRLEALYRANNNQSQPISDPYGSFKYEHTDPISINNIVAIRGC